MSPALGSSALLKEKGFSEGGPLPKIHLVLHLVHSGFAACTPSGLCFPGSLILGACVRLLQRCLNGTGRSSGAAASAGSSVADPFLEM